MVVVVLLAEGNRSRAEIARQTLAKLPPSDLRTARSRAISSRSSSIALAAVYLDNAEVMEQLLAHAAHRRSRPSRTPPRAVGEQVAELIATNEQRMLAHPPIIERLYMNKATRMSTADRIIELAVRNKLELTGIPAYKEVAIAIGQELIEEAHEPSPRPTTSSSARRSTKERRSRSTPPPRTPTTSTTKEKRRSPTSSCRSTPDRER